MTEIFHLLIIYLINTLLFARIKQISKSKVCKQPFVFLKISVPRERIKKIAKILEKSCKRVHFLVKL